MLWIIRRVREGPRASAWARQSQKRQSLSNAKRCTRQLVRAECSVYVHTLALHARVTRGNHFAATRERFAATDSETSAAAEQAAGATTKASGAQQVRTPPPTEAQYTKPQ